MKNLKYILILLVMMGSASCGDDYLELTDPNQIDKETFWNTEEDFEKGVNGIYQSMYYDGSYMRLAPLALDLRGDDVRGDSPWPVIDLAGRFGRATDELLQHWTWIAFYGGVHRANNVISRIENPEIEFSSQEARNALHGQALFLRGLYYMHLVTWYNNIPLVLEPYETPDDFYPEQSDPAAVWNQIIQDFQQAAELLPQSYTDASDLGRATKGAATAYLGKAYLFNEQYQAAANEFQKVMGMGYSLMPNYADNFTEEHENNAESIYEIQFDREVGGAELGWVRMPAANWSKTSARAITYAPVGFGWSDVLPTRWAFEQFMVEPTAEGNVDPRLDATMFYNYPGATVYGVPYEQQYGEGTTDIYPKKYQNYRTLPDEFDWRSGINERLMRYADVLLMYAETQIALGNTAEAAKYIQMVRSRANLPDREAELAAMSPDALFMELAHQRLLEFTFEGKRFDDIRRWGWLEDPAMLAELKARDSEFNGYTPGREFYFIPQAELDRHPTMVQNPGY
ncbi:SusD/RagB family protein [Flammeovirgaceae bacterium 311]|nr:SusD/RagB family protein [Flammeovirgaceae bacterium 311]